MRLIINHITHISPTFILSIILSYIYSYYSLRPTFILVLTFYVVIDFCVDTLLFKVLFCNAIVL